MPRTLLVALVAALSFPALSTIDAGGDPQVPCADPLGCPDLIVLSSTMNPSRQTRTFSPTSCSVIEGMVEPGTRELLRFTFTTPNLGPGNLIVGRPEDHPEWFEYSPCHGHHHFRHYSAYRLWTPSGFAQWDALRAADPDARPSEVMTAHPELASQVVLGRKLGFCVMDVRPSPHGLLIGPPLFPTCIYQGISVGWADEYFSSLDGQWIDVTGLPAGPYVLEAEVNIDRLYEEADYTNNRAWRSVSI